MEVPTLEEITLIKIGTAVWMRNDLKVFLAKQKNGLLKIEKALTMLNESIDDLLIAVHLKNRLTDVVERIGYELNRFLIKTSLCGAVGIQWSMVGLINEKLTLRNVMENTEHFSAPHFKYASLICDEEIVTKIWNQFTDDEKNECEKTFRFLVLPSYWIYQMSDRLATFAIDYGHLIIGFDSNLTLHNNMLLYCLTNNNSEGIHYFYQHTKENGIFGRINQAEVLNDALLPYALENPSLEHLNFIIGFLEKPLPSYKHLKLIVNKIAKNALKLLLEHALRKVNMFGNLHYNIFRSLLCEAKNKCLDLVRENLDFYALSLLSKGRLEKFEYLADIDPRKILSNRIFNRFKNSTNLSIFLTINLNGHTELLINFIEWCATHDNETFLRSYVNAIIRGTQYDSPQNLIF